MIFTTHIGESYYKGLDIPSPSHLLPEAFHHTLKWWKSSGCLWTSHQPSLELSTGITLFLTQLRKRIDGWLIVSWESEATPSATLFFKRAYKISHPPRLWVSWIDLPSFASSLKIWPNFSNKVFFSWSYEKVILTKNVRLTFYSSMKKKFRKIRMIFDIENSLWKSNFCTLRWAGKARQSIPGCL